MAVGGRLEFPPNKVSLCGFSDLSGLSSVWVNRDQEILDWSYFHPLVAATLGRHSCAISREARRRS